MNDQTQAHDPVKEATKLEFKVCQICTGCQQVDRSDIS